MAVSPGRLMPVTLETRLRPAGAAETLDRRLKLARRDPMH